MNKPWYNEPTPIVNVLKECIEDGSSVPAEMLELAENLERRLRHAEKLLDLATIDPTCLHIAKEWVEAKSAHLEAARQEDGR